MSSTKKSIKNNNKNKTKKVKDNCSQDKINKFSHLFAAYINQIFGDIGGVRPIIYNLYGNKKHNKDFKFGLVQFHRYDDLSEDDEDYDKSEYDDANTDGTVAMDEAEYYDYETDLDIDDSDTNHHVLYDVKNEKYLDSVNTQGYKYQDQERDEHDSLCQSYTLMFFFDRPMDNDPVQKQMQIIDMYKWLIKQPKFIHALENDMFYPKNKKDEVWEDEKGKKISTQGPEQLYRLIKKIKETLKIWKEYGYRHFIGDGSCESHKNYNIEDYDLTREESDDEYSDDETNDSVDYDSIFGASSDEYNSNSIELK